MMADYKGEIVLYQPDAEVKLEVRLENETVWLTQAQMAELFQTTKQNVSLHTGNIFKEGELDMAAVVKESFTTATDLIRSAKTSLLLIDNYVDESTLMMLSKRDTGVSATIYTQRITQQLQLDIDRHNRQYPPIDVQAYRNSHDRFLIIDNAAVYHIGASMKDLGKKMFAFSKLNIPAATITDLL